MFFFYYYFQLKQFFQRGNVRLCGTWTKYTGTKTNKRNKKTRNLFNQNYNGKSGRGITIE